MEARTATTSSTSHNTESGSWKSLTNSREDSALSSVRHSAVSAEARTHRTAPARIRALPRALGKVMVSPRSHRETPRLNTNSVVHTDESTDHGPKGCAMIFSAFATP